MSDILIQAMERAIAAIPGISSRGDYYWQGVVADLEQALTKHYNSIPHFVGKNGERFYFKEVAAVIAEKHPNLVGAHIFLQVDALGWREQFDGGHSPHPLPHSFSEYA